MTLHSDTPIGDDSNIPKAALWLGLGGLVPFIAGMLLVFQEGAGLMSNSKAQLFLMGYGAVILSFLGGARWGLALNHSARKGEARELTLSVLPSLLGWSALLLPFLHGVLVFAVAFFITGLWDRQSIKNGKGPYWYANLRVLLTTIVVTLLLIIWMARRFL